LLALASRVPFRLLALRVWLPVLLFTGLIALPAIFLTRGETLAWMPWSITLQGIRTASLLVLRAECAASLLFLLTVTTPWNHLLRALRWLRIPAAVVALLQVSYRYIFVLLETANNMFESRQTRLIGQMEPRIQRRFAAASAAVLLDKALETSSEVHCAMQARGFRGDIVILNDLRMDRSNWLYAASFVVAGILMICFGR
jgi:cobalt/nickel transport system permease protein